MKLHLLLFISLIAIYANGQMIPEQEGMPTMEVLDRDIAILKASIASRLEYIKNFMNTAAKSHMNKMLDFSDFRFKEGQQNGEFQSFIKNDEDQNESFNEDLQTDENLNNGETNQIQDSIALNNSKISQSQASNISNSDQLQSLNNSSPNNQTNASASNQNDRYLRYNTSSGVYDLLSNATIRDDLIQIRGTSCSSLAECLQLNKKFYHFVRSALKGRDGINGKRGPRGPNGDQGPQGPQGDAGPNGYTPSREFIMQLIRSYVKQALFKLASNSLLYKAGMLGATALQQQQPPVQQVAQAAQNSVSAQIAPQLDKKEEIQQQKGEAKSMEGDKIVDDDQLEVVKTTKKQKKNRRNEKLKKVSENF